MITQTNSSDRVRAVNQEFENIVNEFQVLSHQFRTYP